MSETPPGPSQQTRHRRRSSKSAAGSSGHKPGGTSVEIFLHHVTDAQADLIDTGGEDLLKKITRKTGADVELDPSPSTVGNTKTVRIRGARPQIEAALRLINQKTGDQETVTARAQTYWRLWVEAAFPDLDSRAYFLPPVYFNRVPMARQSIAGQEVLVLHEAPGQADKSIQSVTKPSASPRSSIPPSPVVQDSDVRDDAAMQRLLFCLQTLVEEKKEVLAGLSQLRFGQYLGEPSYAAVTAKLPSPASLPLAPLHMWRQGDFDVLIIHRCYGLVVCEVKSFGDNIKSLNMSQQDIDNNIRKKLRDSLAFLDKSEVMLSHLVSDIGAGLRITKVIAVPNLTARQIQQAISGDVLLTQDLCRCLGTIDSANITGLCLCSDQLSDPKTPWDVNSDVLRELGNWWQRRVAVHGPDSHMTVNLYKELVARFCGPATTVTVPCTSPPRLCVKTLGHAVSWTGECYTAQITLFPEQVCLLNTGPPRLFVSGPPGTGKSVVLLLKSIEWLRCGNDVYIVITSKASRAACSLLHHLLLQTVSTQLTAVVSPGRPHRLEYDFCKAKDVEKAVNDLSLAAREGPLYAIADEAGSFWPDDFRVFCDKLLSNVPRLQLWAASCYQGDAPVGWEVKYLTRPLRCPPAVVREVQQAEEIAGIQSVQAYSGRGVPDHTDGPPVRRLRHRGQGHSGDMPDDCVTCGRKVASFLQSLHAGASVVTASSGSATPPSLQWRDMLVLSWNEVSEKSELVMELGKANIPVLVMRDDDIDDVATARSDVVWVVGKHRVYGLERKVVVCLPDVSTTRLHLMSRCTSQLVIVYSQFEGSLRRTTQSLGKGHKAV